MTKLQDLVSRMVVAIVEISHATKTGRYYQSTTLGSRAILKRARSSAVKLIARGFDHLTARTAVCRWQRPKVEHL